MSPAASAVAAAALGAGSTLASVLAAGCAILPPAPFSTTGSEVAALEATGLVNWSDPGGTQPEPIVANRAQNAASDTGGRPLDRKTIWNQSSFFRVIKPLRTKPCSPFRYELAPYYDETGSKPGAHHGREHGR